MINNLKLVCLLTLIFSANIYSNEYRVSFKNNIILLWGGDPVCNCPLPEEAIFIEQRTNREIKIADNSIIERYYTLQKSFNYDERSGKQMWRLKSKYRNKIFRIVVKYDRCIELNSNEYVNCDIYYNNQLKSIYPIN